MATIKDIFGETAIFVKTWSLSKKFGYVIQEDYEITKESFESNEMIDLDNSNYYETILDFERNKRVSIHFRNNNLKYEFTITITKKKLGWVDIKYHYESPHINVQNSSTGTDVIILDNQDNFSFTFDGENFTYSVFFEQVNLLKKILNCLKIEGLQYYDVLNLIYTCND